jgi:phage-related protein
MINDQPTEEQQWEKRWHEVMTARIWVVGHFEMANSSRATSSATISDRIPKKAKAKFTKRLLHLEGTAPGLWTRPYVDTLTDHCAGLFEIRTRLGKVQYRILGFHNARQQPTLAHCFIKPGDEVPKGDCDSAFEVRNIVQQDPARYRVEH